MQRFQLSLILRNADQIEALSSFNHTPIWATPFEIHTPPVEDLGKMSHKEGANFQMHLTFCVIFRLGLSQRE